MSLGNPQPVFPPPRFTHQSIFGKVTVTTPDQKWLYDYTAAIYEWASRGPGLFRGPDVPSASSITISYPFTRVTGSASIANIIVPPGYSGGQIFLVNGGSWKLISGGNLATEFRPTAGVVVPLVYDPISALWYVPEGLSIGVSVLGGTANEVLFVDGSGLLAQSGDFRWTGAALELKQPLSMLSGADVSLDTGSLVVKYNGLSTVSNGLPSILAQANLTAQVAAITPTTLYAPTADGLFRLSYAMKVTTAATSSSTLGALQVIFTDPDDSVVVTTAAGPTSTVNTTQAQVNDVVIVNAKSGTNIQLQCGYASAGVTAMQFTLHVRLEAL